MQSRGHDDQPLDLSDLAILGGQEGGEDVDMRRAVVQIIPIKPPSTLCPQPVLISGCLHHHMHVCARGRLSRYLFVTFCPTVVCGANSLAFLLAANTHKCIL